MHQALCAILKVIDILNRIIIGWTCVAHTTSNIQKVHNERTRKKHHKTIRLSKTGHTTKHVHLQKSENRSKRLVVLGPFLVALALYTALKRIKPYGHTCNFLQISMFHLDCSLNSLFLCTLPLYLSPSILFISIFFLSFRFCTRILAGRWWWILFMCADWIIRGWGRYGKSNYKFVYVHLYLWEQWNHIRMQHICIPNQFL